ncbi:MAG: DUF1553 domain-containing protein [Planctomycetota bacterium]|nr:MAG: DUF1553 domain-containing protein [Planctomycetota bacterium]
MRDKSLGTAAVFLGLWSGMALGAPRLEFNRDIRPILAENCFACHGPDSAARKADLRLDRREDAIKAGAIVPGKPDESALVERVFETAADKIMPPPKAHKVLKPAQKELLQAWVAQGAEYQLHWSFLTPPRPVVPVVVNKSWARNPVDSFLLAGMEARGLAPAPEADRHTLARRLSFDLTGLPPAPDLVSGFVADQSPDAYEKLVDKLLASSHWGEHRGRYWLDAARFADTHGIHFDNYREMWSYRDWVINAFNKNLPFDQFTIEQLAGDLLPNATLDQRVATGFNRCNITTNEGGAISEEYLVLYARDRTETTSLVWMGLTTGCAVCHDHKFDPVSTKEFYALSAFFNNTTQNAMDGNIKDTPPIMALPKADEQAAWPKLRDGITGQKQRVEERKKSGRVEFDRWLTAVKPTETRRNIPSNNLAFHAELREGQGTEVETRTNGKVAKLKLEGAAWVADKDKTRKDLQINSPGAIALPDVGDLERDKPFTVGAWVQVPRGSSFGPIVARMEKGPGHRGWDLWSENGRFGMHLVSTWPTSGIKVLTKKTFNFGEWHHVMVVYDGSSKAAGVKVFIDGASLETETVNDTLAAAPGTIRTTVPLRIGRRSESEPLNKVRLYDLRLYTVALTPGQVADLGRDGHIADILARDPAKRTAAEKDELFGWWLANQDTSSIDMARKLQDLERQEKEMLGRGTQAHVMAEKPGEAMAFVLARGEYDKRKDQVKPETPAVLPGFPQGAPRNRLGLARWLMLPEHPLTARVTVNRFWQELFGTGLVRTSGDFGVTGELPSHPELLDFLAINFRENAWDVKKFFKLLVTSAAYRQVARATPDKLEKDPANRLLARGPRFRMDAEMIRDNAIAASGLLVPKIGGPSVRPYQPEGVWEAVAMRESNTHTYRRDAGENLYRRSLYTFWKRAAPPASMDILNAPNRETCVVRRERTNTPLQALVTLNDPQFIEAARHMAEQVIVADPAQKALNLSGEALTRARLNAMSMRILSRPLGEGEQRVMASEVVALLAHYQARPVEARELVSQGDTKPAAGLPAGELATWTLVANTLFNLDETLNK